MTEYKIYDGNDVIATVSSTTVDLSSYQMASGSHTITAKATGQYFTDSATSNSVTYTVSSGYNLTIDVESSSRDDIGPLYLYIKLNSAPANANDYDIRIFAPDAYSDYENHGVDGPLSGGQYIGDDWSKVLSATEFYVWGEGRDYVQTVSYQPTGGNVTNITPYFKYDSGIVAYNNAIHVTLTADTRLYVRYYYFQGSWD